MAPTRALDRPVKTSGLLSIPHALFHSLKGSGPIALLMKQLLRCRPRYSESRCDIDKPLATKTVAVEIKWWLVVPMTLTSG